MVIAGPSGAGKTRMLVELCDTSARSAGVPSFSPRMLTACQPTMAVVSSSSSTTRIYGGEVDAVLAWQNDRVAPTRVALVARSAHRWWSSLLEGRPRLRIARVETLTGSFGSPGGTDAYYRAAVRSFAAILADIDRRRRRRLADRLGTVRARERRGHRRRRVFRPAGHSVAARSSRVRCVGRCGDGAASDRPHRDDDGIGAGRHRSRRYRTPPRACSIYALPRWGCTAPKTAASH